MTVNIEKELEVIQEQIEKTNEPITKSYLLLKKIDLLKILEAQKQFVELNYKKIIKQLEIDIKNERKKGIVQKNKKISPIQ